MEKDNKYIAHYKSPVGFLEIVGTEKGIISVSFVDKIPDDEASVHSCLNECLSQLEEYFKKKRHSFSLPLLLHGTDFQKRVWDELVKIPYGTTVSYGDVATSLGNKGAARAVGGAAGKNRIAIIVPCHRVIACGEKLGGFGGGIWRKEWLLNHEKKKK